MPMRLPQSFAVWSLSESVCPTCWHHQNFTGKLRVGIAGFQLQASWFMHSPGTVGHHSLIKEHLPTTRLAVVTIIIVFGISSVQGSLEKRNADPSQTGRLCAKRWSALDAGFLRSGAGCHTTGEFQQLNFLPMPP